MVRAIVSAVVVSVSTLIGGVVSASAQDAQTPPPPKIWTVTASAGLALASGNTNTSSLNAAYDIVYDPQSRNVVKSDGLLLRGKTDGELSANRLGLNVRDEYELTPRLYVFGQNQYLRDEFKEIDYLVAPTGGLGYKAIDTEATKLNVDASVGSVWEKNRGSEVNASGAVAVGQKLAQTLTSTTTLNQTFAGLWRMDDWNDSLFTFGVSIATSISTRIQLKLEALDTFKNKPPAVDIERNDVAVLMAIVYKN